VIAPPLTPDVPCPRPAEGVAGKGEPLPTGCQTVIVRRIAIVIGLLVTLVGTTAGCSPSQSSLPVCTYGNPGHLVTTPTGQVYTTATAPCTPTTTTSTTLPPPLSLGTTATLAYGSGDATVQGQFTVNRVWTNATPQYVPSGIAPPFGTTLSQAISHLLEGSHLPQDEKLAWVGVDLTVTNTGRQWIGLQGAGGPSAPVLTFVVNGHGIWSGDGSSYGLSTSGFAIGVPGCSFPFPPSGGGGVLNPGQSLSGCVALAVPAGVTVSTVGFDLQPVTGAPGVQHVAQWIPTTTTLPGSLALGSTAVLSGDGQNEVNVRFTVNRVWVGATPQFHGSFGSLSQAVHQIFPKPINLTWVGVDLTVTNSGQGDPALASPTGVGGSYLSVVVNGQGGTITRTATSNLADLAFEVGVPGCPFPFANLQVPAPGASGSGCVAIPVPAGVIVSTVGFALEFAAGGNVPSVAQWQVSGE
jgi:hypothetical protein